MSESISKDLLDILACPLGKSKVRLEGDKLVCTRCGVKFPIKNGIPVMLMDEAELPPGCERVEDLPCQAEES